MIKYIKYLSLASPAVIYMSKSNKDVVVVLTLNEALMYKMGRLNSSVAKKNLFIVIIYN